MKLAHQGNAVVALRGQGIQSSKIHHVENQANASRVTLSRLGLIGNLGIRAKFDWRSAQHWPNADFAFTGVVNPVPILLAEANNLEST